MATNAEFLTTIKEGCIQGWRDHAVLASISGAQAILESNWGKSTLALKANNLFGIKGEYNGESFSVETKEFISGVVKYVTAAFRKYPSWAESIADHGAFFTSTEWRKTNYAAVVGETDYKKAAQALSTAGYATDPDYPAKLIKLIETYDLQQWDVPETEEEETKVVKVYISPSSQHDNVGVGNYGTEEVRMNQVADRVEKELKRVGIVTLRNNPSMDITQMVAASNNFGADVHLSIHSNAGGATGAEAYYYTGSTAGKKLAQAVYDNIAPMTPTGDRGVKATTELYEVWATNGIATLVEIAFHDNAADAAFIINNIQELGIAIAKGVCSYLGINFGTIDTPTVTVIAAAVETVGPVRIPVAYDATITSGGYSIDSVPWGEDGLVNWGTTDAQVGKAFYFYEENASGEYANGMGLGWVDKRALTKGIIAQPTPAAPEPEQAPVTAAEPEVIASILYLPNGHNWTVYPPDGPYTAGDIISTEAPKADAGLYLTILGDRGNNIVIVELPNFGTVGIYFDPDKGAAINKVYA